MRHIWCADHFSWQPEAEAPAGVQTHRQGGGTLTGQFLKVPNDRPCAAPGGLPGVSHGEVSEGADKRVESVVSKR